MKIFQNSRLSIFVNILALLFFISPFYPNGCSNKTLVQDNSQMVADSIRSSTASESLTSLENDTVASSCGSGPLTSIDTVVQTEKNNKLSEALSGFLFGVDHTITGFSCVVFGMSSYISQYGIITAFLFLLICLMLKNTYEKRKYIIISILELISIPFLFFTDFDIFYIKAVPDEKLWGFWVCLVLIILLLLIDVSQIIKRERKYE